MREHDAAGVGQLGCAVAARRAPQHRGADDALQGADLLADCRLRVAQLARGTAERALIDDRGKGAHVADFERAPAISVSHRLRGYSELLFWLRARKLS
jgi:hypothetical protein